MSIERKVGFITAAIYARKSTEQHNVSDDEKSVTRQIEHAKAYAIKKGWTVSDDLIFIDDGISGAEFVKRPGFIRLMNALKPKPSFHVLVMSEESRLGRESIETSYALKQIIDAGVRLFFYMEDRERTLESAMDKVMLSLTNFASEMERERAKQRTYDAMLRKAKAGHVTGGIVYGFDNREITSAEGKRLHVVRVVNEPEAARVRQIFEMYAGGLGITRIAKRLNDESVPAPRQGPNGWAPSAVREILYRPLYRGQIVWNESQKVVRGGTKKRRRRPDSERITVDAPELRIVTPELWESVQSRLTRSADRTRPRVRDIETKYLLTGMARCAHCGGPMMVIGPGTSRRQGRFYACAYHRKRGSKICKNSMLAEQELLDKVLLRSLATVLHEQVLDRAIEQALVQIRSQQHTQLDRRTQIERELSLIEATEKRLVEGIAKGEFMDPLLVRLRAEETRKKELIAELSHMEQGGASEWDMARLKRELRARVANLPSLLGRDVSESRKLLRVLFEEPIQCHAVVEGGESKYKLSGTGNFLNLLTSSTAHLAWCPQRDLNPCYCLERAMS